VRRAPELMTVPYYRDAAAAPPDSPAGKMLASARHLSEHLGEAPVLVVACIALDPGVKATLTAGASIYPAVQNLMLAARALGIGSCITTMHRFRDAQVGEGSARRSGRRRDRGVDPLGYPRGKFGRPPRRSLHEVAFADRWGQAF
jgi:nitroreductase